MADYPFRTMTFMMRNRLVRLPDWFEGVTYGDMCVLALYAEKGPIAYLDEVTGTYRMHGGGIWSGYSVSEKCKATQKALDTLSAHFQGRYDKVLRRRDFRMFKQTLATGYTKGAVPR